MKRIHSLGYEKLFEKVENGDTFDDNELLHIRKFHQENQMKIVEKKPVMEPLPEFKTPNEQKVDEDLEHGERLVTRSKKMRLFIEQQDEIFSEEEVSGTDTSDEEYVFEEPEECDDEIVEFPKKVVKHKMILPISKKERQLPPKKRVLIQTKQDHTVDTIVSLLVLHDSVLRDSWTNLYDSIKEYIAQNCTKKEIC